MASPRGIDHICFFIEICFVIEYCLLYCLLFIIFVILFIIFVILFIILVFIFNWFFYLTFYLTFDCCSVPIKFKNVVALRSLSCREKLTVKSSLHFVRHFLRLNRNYFMAFLWLSMIISK